MTPRSIRVAQSAYLDTCVISGYVKGELQACEKLAFEAIMSAYQMETIDLLRSAVVDQEIAAIPEQYRSPHQALLSTLLSIPVPNVGGLTRCGSAGYGTANPSRMLWNRLIAVLPDENDRSHVFVAARNRVHFFVTVDFRTILSRRSKVLAASGVEPVTPSEFVAHAHGPMLFADTVLRSTLLRSET
ncbi:hypothetical protein [Rhodoferax sp.]|uniref:hypothetical protein n=1 Tax=Rhodoferax sp. TaxID=50421 RepID=UPI002770B3C3|nr:hypothetical protein [Rhodoferax sp.]